MTASDDHGGDVPQPQKRFPEFECTGDWEERKIGDFLTESRDKGREGDFAKKLTVNLWGKGVFENREPLFDSACLQYYRRSAGQFIYSKLDFLNQAFGIIPDALDGYESTTDLPCFDISSGLNPTFLLEYVQRESFHKKIGKIVNGGRKAKPIQPNVFFDMPIILPRKDEEQEAIARATLSLDTLIEAETEKLDALKDHKQGLMQQLFPAEGRKHPKLRFPEFKGDWTETKLGNIATFSKGKGIAKNEIDPEGSIYCIWYGELYTTYDTIIEQPVSRTSEKLDDLVLSKGGEVIIPASGEDANDIATAAVVVNQGVALGGNLIIISSRLNGAFLAYYLSGAKIRTLTARAQRNSVVHLYPNQLETLDIFIPSSSEQIKVASCLASIDELLAAYRANIDILHKFKRGLLQRLLPALDEVTG